MSEVIFVSSVQKEIEAERRAVRDFVRGDALLRRFFDVFLFEDLPASDCRADDVYLDEVGRCAIYLGIFGDEYGWEDAAGISPTEREFDEATERGRVRLIFVKGAGDSRRHPKMRALIGKAGGQLIRRRFESITELTAALYASLVDHLADRGLLQNRPFDERPCGEATLDDLDPKAVGDFVHRARYERQFPLPEGTAVADVVAHLNLVRDARPTHAAVLLFGRDPQRFIPCAEVRCMHFHGTEIERPAPFYRIFKGNLFEQVDHAENFVLSVVNRAVGTRAESTRAPLTFEIPPAVVREAIVNAVAHRDYASAAAVQVSVFADRIEVWNPGELPAPLTPERLREPHSSIARNARVCEALFLARYIEKYGTGTLMMIRECQAHGLPEPNFGQQAGEFVASVARDWLTADVVARIGLNERQRTSLAHLKTQGRITNREYQAITCAIPRTAARDLRDLEQKGVVRKVGTTGRGAYYVAAGKPDRNRTNTPTRPETGQKQDKQDTAEGGPTAPSGGGVKRSKGTK